MWSAEQNISQAGKGVFHKIPGHVRDKSTGNLYTCLLYTSDAADE